MHAMLYLHNEPRYSGLDSNSGTKSLLHHHVWVQSIKHVLPSILHNSCSWLGLSLGCICDESARDASACQEFQQVKLNGSQAKKAYLRLPLLVY